jgi:hypothetical protein
VVSLIALSATSVKFRDRNDGLPSSCFRFFDLGGITAISPFGVALPFSGLCSFPTPGIVAETFELAFFLIQLSTWSFRACRIIGLLQCSQETSSGDSSIGILPYVSRSRGSSCFATGEPTSELGGD